MSVRILRAIRFFDWVLSADIAMAIGIPSSNEDALHRNNFDVNLGRLFRQGHLERRLYGAFSLSVFTYRITKPGREYLAQALSIAA